MTQQEIIGKTFYCTSQYAKNLPFVITGKHRHESVTVNTYEGRNCITNKPMGRVIGAIYQNETIFEMIEKNIITLKKQH